MKIKRLEIHGFKSFVDKTVVRFDHEVTGIVGPNGCGKSNIVDAIRWVMGEQSAKTLRGKGMEDVIFNGCESRGPHSFAEVSITFDNTDGLSAPEYQAYADITVSRRLDRDGRSDYFLNKAPVRLLDITNLFLGTGVGKQAYSIIEQGRIGYIVSSKPADRRQLLEEAAGVTKYKLRRKAAERKMDQTRQNLLRVGDIVHEIERSLASLKRQAQKAERYKRYKEENRDLELHVASHRWLELRGSRMVLAERLGRATAETAGQRRALRVREAETELERGALREKESLVEKAQGRAHELDNAAQLLASEIEHRKERLESLKRAEAQMGAELAELATQRTNLESEGQLLQSSLHDLEDREREAALLLQAEMEQLEARRQVRDEAEAVLSKAQLRVSDADTQIARAETALSGSTERERSDLDRLSRLSAEREELKNRIVENEQARSALLARLEGLRSGREQKVMHRGTVEAELEQLRNEHRTSQGNLDRLKDQLTQKRSRLRSLEEIHQRFEGLGQGVRSVMQRAGDNAGERAEKGILGLLADRLDCPQAMTQALAGALGERLSYVVVEGVDSGLTALRDLREQATGRATIVPRSSKSRRSIPPPAPPEGQGVHGRLSDLISYSTDDEDLVQLLLGGIVVVDDLQTAVSLYQQHDGLRRPVVTLTGEVLRPDGSMTGGQGEDGVAHMLDVQREIRELTSVVATVSAELDTVMTRHGAISTKIAALQAALDSARSENHDVEISIVKVEKDVKGTETEALDIQGRIKALDREFEAVNRDLEGIRQVAVDASKEIQASKLQREESESQRAAAEALRVQRLEAVEEQSSKVTEVRVQAAQARERAEADRASRARLKEAVDELLGRHDRLDGELKSSVTQQVELRSQLDAGLTRRTTIQAEVLEANEALSVHRTAYDQMRDAMEAQEVELKELRSGLEGRAEELNEVSLEEREAALAIQHLAEQIFDRYRVELTSVLTDFHDRAVPDEAVHSRIADLARLIERMGEINLTAIEEYEEKSERYEYLTSQTKDLDEALVTLEKAIRQMNKESRRLFKEAFHAVNDRFQRVFPTMFGGGRAELRLTDPNDLLESGIDIVAQPPGKRIGSLELMSGGEKALTAVSLIFAIFQYKPSPFCLLDEVDAPLDEANIGRFSDAVRQMTDRSQFIIITHAKRTMESADVLYGVTMETPGISKLVSVELRGDGRRRIGGDNNAARVA